MAIPCPPAEVRQSVIMAEFGVTGNSVYLSRTLGPFIGKPSGTKVAFSDFCGASSNSGPEANGGTINDSNGWRHHIFTVAGQFCITKAGVGGSDQTTIHALIVGGGGGGGSGGTQGVDKNELGAGGGAGGYFTSTSTVPNSVACYSNTIGFGGAGASATNLARGSAGTASLMKVGATTKMTGYGGGGGGSMYNGQWDGGSSQGSGGGGGGKFEGTSGTIGGSGGVQGNKGGNGGAYGAGGGGGHRTNGNTQNVSTQTGGGGGGGTTYTPQNKSYAVGGGGAGYLAGGSGYNQGGNGGKSRGGGGIATAAVREGCGGGGGGAGGHSNGGENGKNGKSGIIIYSYKL